MIQQLSSGAELLGYIIRSERYPDKSTFYTPSTAHLQVGHIVYEHGQEIGRHVHLPVERTITSTTEVLLVQKGHCVMDVYDSDRQRVCESELVEGDIVVMLGGGHGFRMIEDTILLEIKQGPYGGMHEKERF